MKEILNEEVQKLNKIDFIFLIIGVIIYSLIFLPTLGNNTSPNTFYRINKDNSIDITINEKANKMKFLLGEKDTKFRLFIEENNELEFIEMVESNKKFAWKELNIDSNFNKIRLTFLKETSIGEIAFYRNDKQIQIKDIKGDNNTKYLYDEQNLIPEQISYKNSTYFDEIYFATTAYQIIHNLKITEWTHPPLGKLIEAIPIKITGKMTPFHYRFMGNLSGTIMLIVMYLFGIEFFHKRKYGIASFLIMSCDTLHFAQTRMATVDSHLVLMMMLSSLFMLYYIHYKKDKDLFLSGLFFGLSISIKWTAFYGGIALAILYFINLYKNKELKKLNVYIKGFLFFVIIPITLYGSIYLLFPNNYYKTDNIENIIKEQQKMYNYHSKLKEDHYFSSKWYTWPISYKPVWYHEEELSKNTKETISGIGNLIIWISGLLGIIYIGSISIWKKERKGLFLLIFYLSLWIPYLFIPRTMFLYHYFPTLPYLILASIYLIKDLEEEYKIKYVLVTYIVCSMLFFIIYYPIVSGMKISKTYVENLQLFSSWYF